MKMTINQVITHFNVISKISFIHNDEEIPSQLKVKLIKYRIELNKVKKSFDSDIQECLNTLLTPEFILLRDKTERTEAEEEKFKSLADKINEEYTLFASNKLKEEVEITEYTFTDEDFTEIVKTNSINDVEINGIKLSAPDFLDLVYSLFITV